MKHKPEVICPNKASGLPAPLACRWANIKGFAWLHGLRSHFSTTQTTEGLVYTVCLSHWDDEERGRAKTPRAKEEQREKKEKGNHGRKKHWETPGFQLVGGEIGCGIYWKDCPVLSVTERRRAGGSGGGGGVVVSGEGCRIRRRWDEKRSVGLSLQTAHLCKLLEAGTEKIRNGGSSFRKLLQHFSTSNIWPHYWVIFLDAHTCFLPGTSVKSTCFTIHF